MLSHVPLRMMRPPLLTESVPEPELVNSPAEVSVPAPTFDTIVP